MREVLQEEANLKRENVACQIELSRIMQGVKKRWDIGEKEGKRV